MPRDLLAQPSTSQPRDLLAGITPNLLTDPVETFKRSGGKFAGEIVEAVTHPIQTAKALAGLAGGVGAKLIPGEQDIEKNADALVDFYKDRYGSLDKAKKLALEDPVGLLSDVSIFLTGGGAAASKVGTVGKIGKVAKVGKTVSKVGQMVDPLRIATKTTGKLVKTATKVVPGSGVKIAPFAKKLNNPVIRAAQRLDVDVPASSKTTSTVPPIIEATVAKGFFGSKLLEKIEKAKQSLVDIGDDIIRKTGKSDDLGKAGDAIIEGAERFRKRFYQVKDDLYQKAIIPSRAVDGQPVVRVRPKASLEALNTIIRGKSRAGAVLGDMVTPGPFQKIKAKLKPKIQFKKNLEPFASEAMKYDSFDDFVRETPGIDRILLQDAFAESRKALPKASDVRAAIKELNQRMSFKSADPVVTGDVAKFRKFAAALSDDMDNALIRERPELAQSIKRANKFFKLSMDEINSHFGKRIFELKDQPDKILPAILKNSTSTNDVKRIYRLIGQDNVKNVQAAFLREFLEGAKNASTKNFTPQGIAGQIKKFGRAKLSKVLDADQVKVLDDLDTVSQSMSKLDKVQSGSQTAFIQRALVFGLAPTLTGDVATTAKLLLGDLAGSKFIQSPAGQRLLSTGLDINIPVIKRGGEQLGRQLIRSSEPVGRAGRIGRVGTIIRREREGQTK